MQASDELTQLADQNADSTNSNARYMAYGARLRTALMAAQRYVMSSFWAALQETYGHQICCVHV